MKMECNFCKKLQSIKEIVNGTAGRYSKPYLNFHLACGCEVTYVIEGEREWFENKESKKKRKQRAELLKEQKAKIEKDIKSLESGSVRSDATLESEHDNSHP